MHVEFQSFFMAGFECSSHRRSDGVRLDLIRSTAHDRLAHNDYQSCAELGLRTVRDGLRWHLIERAPGHYDWSSWIPMLEAAASTGTQVIWDIFHYGSPDYLDQGSAGFIEAYARFAAEAVRIHREVTGTAALVCPINEISYFTWAVRTGYFPPAGPDQPGWFKRHLVRAAIAGVEAMRAADPGCRVLWAEPLIHVAPRKREELEIRAAEEARLGQFEAYDMLTGRSAPELGGSPETVDMIGLNFYPDNQWYYQGSTIPLGHYEYRPLAEMLVEAFERFGKPIFISETGAEASGRAPWFHYVCEEVREAKGRGVPVQGICIYPVTAYPGWDNSRHAHVGLFTTPRSDGKRRVFRPLAEELDRQRALFASSVSPTDPAFAA
jgi:beta-glucosidase/6-phospho-beta-glucosidase/beta-galactosidase